MRLESGERERDEERGGERDAEHGEINGATDKKFQHGKEPTLFIDAADRQENLDAKNRPQKRDQ